MRQLRQASFPLLFALGLATMSGAGCLQIVQPAADTSTDTLAPGQTAGSGGVSTPGGGGGTAGGGASTPSSPARCQLTAQFTTIKDFDPVAIFGAGSASGIDQIYLAPDGTFYATAYVWLNNYAASESAVFASTDGGLTWSLRSTLSGTGGGTLAADASGNVYLSVSGATNALDTYLSTDQGAHWSKIDSYLDATMSAGFSSQVAVDGQGHVLVVGFQRTTYPNDYPEARISSDSGAHWATTPTLDLDALLTPGANTGLTAISVDSQGNFYVSANKGDGSTTGTAYIFKSADHGQSWSTLDTIATTTTGGAAQNYTSSTRMIVGPSGNLIYGAAVYDTNGYGHWVARVSTDGGAHWSNTDDLMPALGGYDASSPMALSQDGFGNVYMVGALDEGSDGAGGDLSKNVVRKSSDGGQTWSTVDSLYLSGSPDSSFGMDIAIDSKGQVFTASRDYTNGHFYIRALLCQ